MKGVIKTYLASKKYGFIKGDDKNDYYFRSSNPKAIVGARVEFDEFASPKGYEAKNIIFLQSICDTFELPENIIISKSKEVKGYEILSSGAEFSATDNDIDTCYEVLKKAAAEVGANALIECVYSKEKASRGNYIYSLHTVKARIAFVVRKSFNGKKISIPRLENCQPFTHKHDKNALSLIAIIIIVIFAAFLLLNFLKDYFRVDSIFDLF